jgi:valyl-tRNA synthetase
MRGFNILLPQGWDTQGLPTELVVQKRFDFSSGDVEKFRDTCKEWTKQMIRQMREAMLRLGYMPDWSFEYKTMNEDYHRKVQLALLNLYKMGRIYRAKHPVHWCPKCKTALADAELGYKKEEGELAYIKFKVRKDFVEVATTRPELLHACVVLAFHPKDKRYLHLIGKEAQVPIYNGKVPIIADEAVDSEYGTGLVMICTFGDEQDVKTVLRHKLLTIEGIDDDGKIVNSGKYDGLTIKDARKAILEDLKSCGLLSKTVKITHNVLAHMERSTCQTPIEFMSKPQWFIRITDLKEEIIKLANQIEWFPPHMKNRLIDWVRGLEWDWLFSRQRVFGTSIPFWYCQKCNYIIAPKEDDLPMDPSKENPPINKCPKCGSTALAGAKDVCDCWVDSSITPLIISGWPNKLQYYPLDLRQQGSEIIRTWAFYSITQCYLQTGKPPFKAVLVNGMILGQGGRAMSSSLGNTIEPAEVIEKYGADALRQGLLLASVGSDFPFEWKDIKHCYNFMQKFWNTCRFAQKHLTNYTLPKKIPKLHVIDKGILSLLQKLTNSLTEKMEAFQFNIALQKLQEFVWHELCDYYIENAKSRLYTPKKEWMRKSAQYTLRTLMWTLTRLYAPFAPHITEEISQTLFKKSALNNDWPKLNQNLIDEKAEVIWAILKDVTSKIWKIKSQRRLSLNAEIQNITIRCKDESLTKTLWKLKTEIKDVGKIKRIKILIDEHCPSLEIT